jgi:hypothetical protein
MSAKQHIACLVLCTVFVAAFEYLGLVWSFSDFHPGYIPDLPEYLHRRARIGSAMFLPFEYPLRWITRSAGGFSPPGVIVQWLVLPLGYAVVIYFGFVLICQRLFHANRSP